MLGPRYWKRRLCAKYKPISISPEFANPFSLIAFIDRLHLYLGSIRTARHPNKKKGCAKNVPIFKLEHVERGLHF